MDKDPENSESESASGCVALAVGSIMAPAILFSVAQALFGSQRHSSASGWNFAPILPYFWPLKWLPVYWLVFAITSAFLSGRHKKQSALGTASFIAIFVYVVAAVLTRWVQKGGAFHFYG